MSFFFTKQECFLFLILFLGLFMALQGKIIACGAALTIYAMILRFVVGPATMALGCVVLGLRGNVLRIAIIQVINY